MGRTFVEHFWSTGLPVSVMAAFVKGLGFSGRWGGMCMFPGTCKGHPFHFLSSSSPSPHHDRPKAPAQLFLQALERLFRQPWTSRVFSPSLSFSVAGSFLFFPFFSFSLPFFSGTVVGEWDPAWETTRLVLFQVLFRR